MTEHRFGRSFRRWPAASPALPAADLRGHWPAQIGQNL